MITYTQNNREWTFLALGVFLWVTITHTSIQKNHLSAKNGVDCGFINCDNSVLYCYVREPSKSHKNFDEW